MSCTRDDEPVGGMDGAYGRRIFGCSRGPASKILCLNPVRRDKGYRAKSTRKGRCKKNSGEIATSTKVVLVDDSYVQLPRNAGEQLRVDLEKHSDFHWARTQDYRRQTDLISYDAPRIARMGFRRGHNSLIRVDLRCKFESPAGKPPCRQDRQC
jgi:hypothetical protein